jgi:hypothetical protein
MSACVARVPRSAGLRARPARSRRGCWTATFSRSSLGSRRCESCSCPSTLPRRTRARTRSPRPWLLTPSDSESSHPELWPVPERFGPAQASPRRSAALTRRGRARRRAQEFPPSPLRVTAALRAASRWLGGGWALNAVADRVHARARPRLAAARALPLPPARGPLAEWLDGAAGQRGDAGAGMSDADGAGGESTGVTDPPQDWDEPGWAGAELALPSAALDWEGGVARALAEAAGRGGQARLGVVLAAHERSDDAPPARVPAAMRVRMRGAAPATVPVGAEPLERQGILPALGAIARHGTRMALLRLWRNPHSGGWGQFLHAWPLTCAAPIGRDPFFPTTWFEDGAVRRLQVAAPPKPLCGT